MLKYRQSRPLETINLKLVVVGNSGVGKTNFLIRYVESTFTTSYYNTIGIDFKMKQVMLDDKKVRMQIWDTAGQERFRTVTSSIYKRADGVMIVYDITDRQSFQALRGWLEEAQKNMNQSTTVMIIGNKTDRQQQRKVTKQQGKQFAKNHNLIHMQVSALSNYQVQQSFEYLASKILENLKKQSEVKKQQQKTPTLKLQQNSSTEFSSRQPSISGRSRKTGSQFQCEC